MRGPSRAGRRRPGDLDSSAQKTDFDSHAVGGSPGAYGRCRRGGWDDGGEQSAVSPGAALSGLPQNHGNGSLTSDTKEGMIQWQA
jgi:hypothetical protein